MSKNVLLPARGRALCVLFFILLAVNLRAVNVLTQHYDLSRTGANTSETNLTPANVNAAQFGKLFTRNVDGYLYAQPLYVAGLTISNQTRDVVFVVTEHDSVFAFDADNPATTNALWQVSLGTSVPYTEVNSCSDLKPEIGITSTPVIDPVTGTIYVEAKTKVATGSTTNYFHYLHALSLTNGAEKFGGPVLISGTVNGITFNPQHANQRAGLLLLSNVVYVAMSSHCDWEPYNGWMFGYNATNLAPVAMFNTTPSSTDGEGAIWSCGMAPAADTNGNIYVITGNGVFNANTGGTNYGMCFLKLSTTNGLSVADWFSPYNESTLSASDRDLGTGGAVLLPGNLVTGMGKNGTNYLLSSTNFGHFSTGTSDTNIVQEFAATLPYDRMSQSPVYWNGPTNQYLYMSTENTNTLTYVFNGSTIQTNPVGLSATKQTSSPGGISISANATTNGILWIIDANNVGTMHAYNAANMPQELWNSQQNAARDALGAAVKFCSPIVADGKVFAPTTNQLVVYGLLGSVSSTLLWTAGSGTDTNWSTALNWTNTIIAGNGPPTASANLLFTNNAATAAATVNNVVNNNFMVASVQYANNAANTSPNYQTTLIAGGQTLTLTNGLTVGTTTDAGAAQVVNALITGTNGTLILSNGLFAVAQGSGTDGLHQAVLDLSGLGTFDAINLQKLAVGVYQLPPQAGNGGQRCSGTVLLARTNWISATTTGITNGILVGWNENQGNGNSSGVQNSSDFGNTLYLGLTNSIFTDAIYVGTDKSLGCLLAFNSTFNNPTAFFRNRDGLSRISYWGIGDTSMRGGSNQSASGTNDFSGGTVNALVNVMTIGASQTSASAGITGNGTGVLRFGAGTIDVNYLTNGWSAGSGTTAGSDLGTGTINVNGTALLKVNGTLALAISSGGGTGVPSGTVNINGGTVWANSIVTGSGTGSIVLNNGTLATTNSASLTTLAVTNSTLHVQLNGGAIGTNFVTTTLAASGVNTITVDSLANVSGLTTFPIISYAGGSPVNGNFVKGALPAGFSANLVNNTAQKRLDLVIAPNTTVTPAMYTVNLYGTNLVISGSNGFPGGLFALLASTNLTVPVNQWLPLSTNPFDTNGGFIFTNPMNAGSQQLFYLLQLQ